MKCPTCNSKAKEYNTKEYICTKCKEQFILTNNGTILLL